VRLLERIEKIAQAKDPRIVQVMASLAGEYDAFWLPAAMVRWQQIYALWCAFP
jgi:hypothetical protein